MKLSSNIKYVTLEPKFKAYYQFTFAKKYQKEIIGSKISLLENINFNNYKNIIQEV